MYKKILIFIIFILIITIPGVLFVISDNYFSERTTIYIDQQVKKETSNIFTSIVSDEFITLCDNEKLVKIVYNKEFNIESILINSAEINKLFRTSSIIIDDLLSKKTIENNLREIEFPLGQLISKAIFTNIGPKIKVEVDPITSYKVDVKTYTKEYGINNCLLEIYLEVQIDLDVMIPLRQERITCNNKFLIFSQILKGEIPRYYYNGNGDVLYIPEDMTIN